jgi:hypothetical protein
MLPLIGAWSSAFVFNPAASRGAVSSGRRDAAVTMSRPFMAAAQPEPGRLGTPEPGPTNLVVERDACGVGFVAYAAPAFERFTRLWPDFGRLLCCRSDKKGRRTHDTLSRALHALGCMEHRGGCGGDSVSGDGAGVLTSVPWELFEAEGALGGKPSVGCGAAMLFLPQEEEHAARAQAIFEAQVESKGYEFLSWRDVPQQKLVLGKLALEALPIIRQAFVYHPSLTGDELENELYQLRRSTQADVLAEGENHPVKLGTYFASLSSRTMVYKGMVQSCVLGPFYKDLQATARPPTRPPSPRKTDATRAGSPLANALSFPSSTACRTRASSPTSPSITAASRLTQSNDSASAQAHLLHLHPRRAPPSPTRPGATHLRMRVAACAPQPQVASRAADVLPGAQRRDQHPHRQRQLAARAGHPARAARPALLD